MYVPGDIEVDAVHAPQHRGTAADTLAAHFERVAFRIGGNDVDRVGMVVRRIEQGSEGKFHSRFMREVERIANAQVIGFKPQHACH